MRTRKPKQIHIPGFKEAEASERRDRALAFVGLKEIIAGIECAHLTPHRLEYLRLIDSPFIIGGTVTNAHVRQFLWVVQSAFTLTDNSAREEFLASTSDLDMMRARDDIDDYLDRAFLDSPHGKATRPYFSFAASMVFQMAEPPYGWTMEKTLDTPIPILFQLIKARTQAMGHTVVNRRSQKKEGDWLDKVQRKLNREAAKQKGAQRGSN